MLDCQASSNNNKEGDTVNCKHCQVQRKTGFSYRNAGVLPARGIKRRINGSGDNQVYWGIQLDQDLLETIISIYPEWFKDYNLNLNTMADGNGNTSSTENSGLSTGTGKVVIPLLQTQDLGSPPKAEVDEASLQKAMDRNKESLKVKLMLRRPINQLVEQGIMPPLKTPPAFHEQRQKLERAKMGDFLKNKIQRRPDRQELIQQHILEDTTVDPSLQDKQRQLKKARLADDLNDRLSHRPGPLELIKGNILQTDETFAQAVKEGQIPFKRTCEGETRKHPPPPRFLIEDDSGSDGALSPPQDSNDQSQSSPVSVSCSLPSMETGESSPATNQGSPESGIDTKASVLSSPPGSIASPVSCHISTPPTPSMAIVQSAGIAIQSPIGPIQSQSSTSSGGSTSSSSSGSSSSKNRKKSKSKAPPKTRTIKFHEYKGPPNAQKNQNFNNLPSETSYDLLLQQQQLFLQWQLEWQQKYPQIILPAAQKNNGDQGIQSNQTSNSQSSQSQNHDIINSPHRTLSKLEDMKVSDLKAELKKRNLPVSGSKPQLIERLKPYTDSAAVAAATASSVSPSQVDAANSVATSASPSLPVSVGGILIDTLPTVTPKSETEPPPISPLVAMDTTASSALPQTEASIGVYKVPSVGTPASASRPPSVVPMDIDNNSNNAVDAMEVSGDSGTVGNVIIHSTGNLTNEDIVKLQQRQIEELQRELQRFLPMVSMPDNQPDIMGQWQWSQLQLQQQQQQQQQQHVLFHTQQPQAVLTTAGGMTVPLASATSHPTLQAQTQVENPVTASSTTNVAAPIDGKLLQRQILQQHLQQKIQQQQIMQQLQQQQQQQQQQQLQHSGTSNIIPSASASAAVKASLAAFLHSQHGTSSVGSVPNPMAPASAGPTQSLATFPTTVVATQVLATNPTIKVEPNDGISATLQPVLLCQTATVSTPVTSVVTMTAKAQTNSLPNGLASHQRTSSLPNFSSLITGKSAPVRTSTEPQFIITKPPPDYAEATKQLNKCKQQFPVTTNTNRSNTGRSGRKSVKSQAVDDVLEILIKNGELPPSAAQEPATPTTPETSKAVSSLTNPLFPVTAPVSTPTSLSISGHSTPSPGVPAVNSITPIHSPSPLTTPSPTRVSSSSPAAVLGDVDNNTPAGLDFDFHLDLDDIDNMDLGVLGGETNDTSTQKVDNAVSAVTSSASSSMTIPCPTSMGTLNSVQNVNQNQVPHPPLMLGEIMDFQDLGANMDMELGDWLDVVMPPTTSITTMPSTSSGTYSNPQTNYNNISEHDPLLSNMVNSHDPFDLFSMDDMDFKAPTDLNSLTWDKVDFAT